MYNLCFKLHIDKIQIPIKYNIKILTSHIYKTLIKNIQLYTITILH